MCSFQSSDSASHSTGRTADYVLQSIFNFNQTKACKRRSNFSAVRHLILCWDKNIEDCICKFQWGEFCRHSARSDVQDAVQYSSYFTVHWFVKKLPSQQCCCQISLIGYSVVLPRYLSNPIVKVSLDLKLFTNYFHIIKYIWAKIVQYLYFQCNLFFLLIKAYITVTASDTLRFWNIIYYSVEAPVIL